MVVLGVSSCEGRLRQPSFINSGLLLLGASFQILPLYSRSFIEFGIQVFVEGRCSQDAFGFRKMLLGNSEKKKKKIRAL